MLEVITLAASTLIFYYITKWSKMFYITTKLLEETMKDQRKILKQLPDGVFICSRANNQSNSSNHIDIKFYN